jgi:hypothetical protein
VDLSFSGEIWYWRGPAPFHFVTVPPEQSDAIAAVSRQVSYGWGVIPVTARVGDTDWTTSLFPRDGGYALPVKKVVRDAEQLDVGDVVDVEMSL